MASDKSGEVSRLYDVRRRLGLGTSRVTYIIGPEGTIQGAFHNELDVSSHIRQALKALDG